MSSILARVHVAMAEAAVEDRGAQRDHTQVQVGQLGRRKEEQNEVVDEAEAIQNDLEADLVEIDEGPNRKILGIFGKSKDKRLEDKQLELEANQAVAQGAGQKAAVIQGEQQELFQDVKEANDRVSTFVGYISEAIQAEEEAKSKGGLS